MEGLRLWQKEKENPYITYVAEKNLSKRANEEMRIYNLTMKVNRLEMLKAEIGIHLVDGFTDLDQYVSETLNGRTTDELKRQAGILGETVKNNDQLAHSIVNASFHNATFSDRIWMHQALLKSELDKQLQQGLIAGKHPQVLARDIRKAFNVSRSDAERLMRTELARVQTDAQMRSFEENGFEWYMFLSLGSRACEVCRALNGKKFKVKDMLISESAPPMRPNCRCSTAAYMNREEFNKWLNEEPKKDTVSEGTKSPKALRSQAENGIIKRNEKERNYPDEIEKYKTTQEIENGFKKFVPNIFNDVSGLDAYDLTGQKEILRGMIDIKDKYGADALPRKIVIEKMQKGDLGAVERSTGKLYLTIGMNVDDIWLTCIHEGVHLGDLSLDKPGKGEFQTSNRIVKAIIKEMGLGRVGGRKMESELRKIMPMRVIPIEGKKTYEILAYAIESEAKGKSTAFTKRLIEEWKKEMMK